MTQNQLQFWQNVETARANRARETQQMFQTVENQRHDIATEGIQQQQADAATEQARASWQNAVTNAYNAEINKQNADTNRLNWEVNAQNAVTNARNASINAYNAETNRLNYGVNAYNADTARMNYGVNLQNAYTNERMAAVAEHNADINELNYYARRDEFFMNSAVAKSQIALNKQRAQEASSHSELMQYQKEKIPYEMALLSTEKDLKAKEVEWYNSQQTADIWNKSVDTIHKGVSLVSDTTRGISGIKNLIALLGG